MNKETGWVIERHVNGTLKYWNGKPHRDGVDRNARDGAFHYDHMEAIRFAREEDASIVLAWLCDGMGRVAEHSWGLDHAG
jgi:hypothetical protein